MKEIIEFRINDKYIDLLSEPYEKKGNGSNTVIFTTKEDQIFEEIRTLDQMIKEKYNDFFFLYSNIKRQYTQRELDSSVLFHLMVNTTFEPAGEECGTIYDRTTACEICGANESQIGPLKLKESSIPHKDIARTIAGEVIISEKLALCINKI